MSVSPFRRKFSTVIASAVIPLDPLTVGMDIWANMESVDKFGKSETIGSSYSPVSGGSSAVLLSAAETLDIVSDDVNDTLTGTGAQKIIITGLDANYTEQTEEIDMDGTTPTVSSKTWIRFYIARVSAVGSDTSGTNLGVITISGSTTTTATLVIDSGDGRTQNAQYTIPAGNTGYMDRIFFTSNAALIMTGQLQVRPFGGAWQVYREIIIQNEHISDNMAGTDPITEKSDIRWMARAATGPNNDATSGFKIILWKNSGG